MAKQLHFEVNGVVTAAFANARFRVKLENGHQIIGHANGRIRKNFVKIVPGDYVAVELSSHDLTKGRISYRYR